MKEKGFPIKEIAIALLSVTVVCLYPPLFLYSSNATEAAFTEIIPVALLFCGMGMLCYGIVFAALCLLHTTGKITKAGVITAIFMLVVLNFSLIEQGIQAILPDTKYWHIVPVLLYLLLHVAYAVKKFISKDNAQLIAGVICIIFGSLVVINMVSCLPQMIDNFRATQKVEEINRTKVHTDQTAKELPNVYYFLFDEYAGFHQMEQYYQYQNEDLRQFFRDNQFSVSYTTHNESVTTDTILTNVMNLNYVVTDEDEAGNKETLRKNGEWYRVMQEHGYKVQILDSTGFIGPSSFIINDSMNTDSLTVDGENLRDIAIKRTVFYPFYKQDTNGAIQGIIESVEFLSSMNNLPEKNTFTVTYFNFPHQPFLVDENGQPVASANWYNWYDDQYYLGQLKYATKLMIRVLGNIVKNDPDSVIIVQSDHGARATGFDGKLFMVKFPLEIMTNTLNAVYYRGNELLEIEGLSSVNTIRKTMNALLDTDYEMLTVPEVK